MQRVSHPDDPNRCHGVSAAGPCPYVKVPPSNFCEMHGGNKAKESADRKACKNYRLTQFRARTEELSNNSNLSSLRDEVAILRMIIEEKVNACQDTQQLLLRSGPLSDLVMKCGTLVEKCQKLEAKLGNHLDKSKVTQFAQICVEIMSIYIDADDMGEVSDKIFKALGDV